MSEIGASISIGVLAAIVVLLIYIVASKTGKWQPQPRYQSPNGAPGQAGQPAQQNQQGQRPYGQPSSNVYNQTTQVYGQPGRNNLPGYGLSADSEAQTRAMSLQQEEERATKEGLARNINYSGQMIAQNRRAATASNGDTLAVFTYIAGAALLAVVVFVFFNNLLLPATIGALCGAIICVALASTFTVKSLAFWPDNSTISIINLVVALAASLAMYIGAERTERDGVSLNSITNSFEPLPFSEGFSAFIGAIGERVVDFFKDYGFTGFVFLLFMAIGCIIVFSLAAKSLVDVMDWRLFAQFGHSVTDRPLPHSRAVRFQSSKVSHTVTSIVLCLIAVLCGTGLLFDGFTWFTR